MACGDARHTGASRSQSNDAGTQGLEGRRLELQLVIQRGYKALYREAHTLLEEINEAREPGELRKYRAQLKGVELLVIDAARAIR